MILPIHIGCSGPAAATLFLLGWLLSCPVLCRPQICGGCRSAGLRSPKSLMKIRKRMGPSTLPCGTPERTSAHDENFPLRTTRCFLPESQFRILVRTRPLTPWARSFSSSLSLGTLSNALAALAKSRNITSKGFPASITLVVFSKNSRRFVLHGFPGIKPCWLGFSRMLLACRLFLAVADPVPF